MEQSEGQVNVAAIQALGDADFRALVADAVRGAVPAEIVAAFRTPGLSRRWLDALQDIHLEIVVQFEERLAEYEEAKYELAVFQRECLTQEGGRDRYLAMKDEFYREAERPYLTWKARASRFKLSVERALRDAKRWNVQRDIVMLRALVMIGRMDSGNASLVANQALAEANNVGEVV